MMPGVTHRPLASTTTASAGAGTVWPTATILPSLSRTDPRSMIGPAAVRIVALRMSVGRDGSRAYVDGYASWTIAPCAPGADAGCCARTAGGTAARAMARAVAAVKRRRILMDLLRVSIWAGALYPARFALAHDAGSSGVTNGAGTATPGAAHRGPRPADQLDGTPESLLGGPSSCGVHFSCGDARRFAAVSATIAVLFEGGDSYAS